jgi:Ni/Fe-hydrogenase subunit HybB-like protein
MSQPAVRVNKNALFGAGALVVMGGILNRLNVSVFGLWSYTGPIYIPSLMEIALTIAMFTFGAAVFAVATRFLPVFPKEESVAETVDA